MPRGDQKMRRKIIALGIAGVASMTKLTQGRGAEMTLPEGHQSGGIDLNPRLFTFVGGASGSWSVDRISAVVGDSSPRITRLEVVHGQARNLPGGTQWVLRGATSNVRYVNRAEQGSLVAKQVAPGRKEAVLAALIPIKKSAAWWELPQDERRKIFEESSHYIAIGLKYLPAISRRLHHCRELGETEPFDFLTWFDYAPEHLQAFEDLVGNLRATEEWKFVQREIDIRLIR